MTDTETSPAPEVTTETRYPRRPCCCEFCGAELQTVETIGWTGDREERGWAQELTLVDGEPSCEECLAVILAEYEAELAAESEVAA